MKVSELISSLKNFDPDMDVEVCVWDGPSNGEDNTGHCSAVHSVDLSELQQDDGGEILHVISINTYPADEPAGEVMPDDCA